MHKYSQFSAWQYRDPSTMSLGEASTPGSRRHPRTLHTPPHSLQGPVEPPRPLARIVLIKITYRWNLIRQH